MYWALRTTLCIALWSDNEQLPYQAVMQLVRMLSGAAVERFEDLGTLYQHIDCATRGGKNLASFLL
jgi:hypothetical protein